MSTAQTQSGAAPRFNMYRPIHKALRAFMSDTLVAVGRMDTNDEAEVAVTLDQARTLLQVLTIHLEDENRFVHAAMEARRPGSAAHTAHDHVEHERALAELARSIDCIAASPSATRAALVSNLYGRLAVFVAENLEHMNVEERDNMAVLWAEYSDEELAAIETSIVASVPPAMMAVATRWMMSALNHAERTGMLQGMRRSAPAEVFEGVLAIARSHLSARDWTKLVNALGLPAARAA
jgi:Hemerythrin HHE cation binding domain